MMQNFGLEDLSHVQSRRNLFKYLVRVEMASDWFTRIYRSILAEEINIQNRDMACKLLEPATNNVYKSKMNCELNFRFIICCQLNEWNKRLFRWCTINANISSLSVLQLFSEKDWIVTVVIEIDWMITAVSLVFQIRDGLGAKARRSPLPDPTLTKRKIG